ncbi:MAG: chemotaxis protein CheD [Marinilabiliales bacterium]|nr:MAG: chemotaxis protein CheD [Marinilabiliales bacterium]
MDDYKEKPYFLYPSALYASKEPIWITTVLGSCVAVCMWDPVLKMGGMNHYMLPYWNGNGLASPKFGNIAIDKLIKRMENLGSNRRNLIAKVFGGGEVIETTIGLFHIGDRNIKIAEELLADYRINIKGSSTGGKQGRKIYFNTYTGVVKQKFVRKQNFG